MTTITTRAGKGSPLTNTEVDDNFSNLNSAKYESGASPTFGSTILTTADTVNLTLDGASANSKNIYFKGDSSAQRGRIASVGTSLYFMLTDATNYLTINPGSTVINDSSVDHDFRVESNDNANMLFVDGGANHVNIGTPTDYGSTFNVGGNTALNRGTNGATTASGATLSIQGTGAYNSNYFGSSLATVAIRSNEPANNGWNPTLHITTIRQSLVTNKDSNGGIGFSTIDDSNNTGIDDAARITIFNENSASNTSPTAIRFYNNAGGSKTQASQAALDLFSTGAVFNNDSNDMDFRVESDTITHALFLDGANGRLGLGTGLPAQKADIAGGGLQISGNIISPASGVIAMQVDYFGGGARYWSRGTDTAVRGTHKFYTLTNTGGSQITPLIIDNTGGVIINEDSADADFRVESDTNANAFHVDGQYSVVGVNTNNATTYTTTNSFVSKGRDFALVGAAGSGATSNNIRFWQDSGTAYEIARIETNVGAGQINRGEMKFQVNNGAVLRRWLDVNYQGSVVFNEDGNDSDFRIEGDSNANMFVVDASNDTIGIGTQPNNNNLSPAMHFVNGGTLFGYGDAMYITGNTYYNGSWKAIATGGGANTVLDNAGFKVYNNASASADATVTPLLHLTVGPSEMVINDDSYDYDFRVESNNNANMLFVDGGEDIVSMGMPAGVPSWIGGNSVVVADNLYGFQAASYDSACYNISVDNNFTYFLHNAYYGSGWKQRLTGYAPTMLQTGSTAWNFSYAADTGSDVNVSWISLMALNSSGAMFNDAGNAGQDFRVESNNISNMLVVDGGNDQVGIGENIPERGVLNIKAPSGSGNKANILLRQESYGAGAFTPQYSYKTGWVDSTGNGTLLTIPFFARSYNQTGYFKITVMGSQYNLSNRATVGVAEFALNLAYPSNIQPLELSGTGNYASVAGNTSGKLLITFSTSYNASTFDGMFYNIEFYAQQGDSGGIDYANITLT